MLEWTAVNISARFQLPSCYTKLLNKIGKNLQIRKITLFNESILVIFDDRTLPEYQPTFKKRFNSVLASK